MFDVRCSMFPSLLSPMPNVCYLGLTPKHSFSFHDPPPRITRRS
jgi:hypothetical protein